MFPAQAILEFENQGYCVLRNHFDSHLVHQCREAFWPRMITHMENVQANRGPHRHFLPMPFDLLCFASQFFFDPDVLAIAKGLMGDRIVADQWSCDVPSLGSEHQEFHVDYQRPLFPELSNLILPPYAIIVSFGLVKIARERGPIEIVSGTHTMTKAAALEVIQRKKFTAEAVPLELGDVLIRHPWAWHRGTPNTTDIPRALCTIRYVRRWYADASRDVEEIPRAIWDSLTTEQQGLMRFPLKAS
jgi:ectoine hydroxylase-related dioxygenase (phytanoyl-CoA dioxygenase family)